MSSPFPRIDRQAAGPLFGLGIMYPSVGALERIGPDWDWIWIDAQHGDLDWRDAVNLVRVTTQIGKPGLVRVPSHDSGWIGKVLDAGAAGIIVPMVETLAEAKAMVQAAKFPPVGNRSYGARRVVDFQGRAYYKTANEDTVLILQLESNQAVGLAEEMAALDGVDGLFLGPDDLFIRDGRDVDTPKTAETLGAQARAIAAACQKHGKLNLGHGVSEDTMAMAKACGYRLIIGGGDVAFLATSSKASSQKVRNYFKGVAPVAAPPPAKNTGSLY